MINIEIGVSSKCIDGDSSGQVSRTTRSVYRPVAWEGYFFVGNTLLYKEGSGFRRNPSSNSRRDTQINAR